MFRDGTDRHTDSMTNSAQWGRVGENHNQLDHILGPGDQMVFTTSFYNFISDHKSIVLRIPLSDTHFIDDERLQQFHKRHQEEGLIKMSESNMDQNEKSGLGSETKKTKTSSDQDILQKSSNNVFPISFKF